MQDVGLGECAQCQAWAVWASGWRTIRRLHAAAARGEMDLEFGSRVQVDGLDTRNDCLLLEVTSDWRSVLLWRIDLGLPLLYERRIPVPVRQPLTSVLPHVHSFFQGQACKLEGIEIVDTVQVIVHSC